MRGFLAGGAVLAAAMGPAEASWFQNAVSAGLTANGGLSVVSPFGPSMMVGPGAEFVAQVTNEAGHAFDVEVDVNSHEITLRFAGPGAPPLADPAGLLEITLTGLEPQPGLLLVSFTCPEPAGTCHFPDAPPEASLSADQSGSLVFGFSALQDGASYTYAIPMPTSAVPAPAGLPLLAAGLAGLALLRRGGRGATASDGG
jgi:hypothetical protein